MSVPDQRGGAGELEEHLTVDHQDVIRKVPGVSQGSVVSSASWSAAGRLSSQGVQFMAGLVLARLLAPADFGLLASVYVVTGFTVLLFDMGLGAALVHQREVRQKDYDSAFWLNALGGLVFVGILAAAGPFVANFYGDSRLTYITPLAGLGFALSLNVCHAALLQRAMQFKKIALIEIACAVAGNVSTVIAAIAGLGVMALVVGPVVQAVAATTLMWSVVRWRPRGFVSRPSMRILWNFSGGVLGSNVVNYAGRNSDNLLIGRVLGATSLGYYNRAYTLMLLPLQQISQVLGRVMFPALAAMGSDTERLQRAYRRVIVTMTAIIMPILVGMAAVADGLVPLLWGDQWLAAIPLLQVLCLAGLPQCLSSSEGWLYQSQGRTQLMFRVSLGSTGLTVAAIVIGLHWGTLGVAIAILIKMWVWQPVGFHIACGLIDLKARRVFADIVPPLAASVVMGLVAWALPWAFDVDRDEKWFLVIRVVVGALVYLGLLRLMGPSVVRNVFSIVPERLIRRLRPRQT